MWGEAENPQQDSKSPVATVDRDAEWAPIGWKDQLKGNK